MALRKGFSGWEAVCLELGIGLRLVVTQDIQ